MTTVDRSELYLRAFEGAGGTAVLAEARFEYLTRYFDAEAGYSGRQPNTNLGEISWGFESLGARQYETGRAEADYAPLFERAFRLRAAMFSADDGDFDPAGLWMLISSGILAQRQPELRLMLSKTELRIPEVDSLNWAGRLWWQSLRAYMLMARKRGPWTDVEESLRSLEHLSGLQAEAEAAYLESADEIDRIVLLGQYHLAEALIVAGRYLRTGEPDSVEVAIQRHVNHFRVAAAQSADVDLSRVASVTEPALISLVRASIWHGTQRLSQAARNFVRTLTSPNGRDPVSELWWSQREALSQSLLDPYKTAISIQMPTSAGKTLLAEFSIVQALALNPEGTVVYLVPTRALVNQITRRLRSDFATASGANGQIAVEAAVPVFELDPTEDQLLSARPEVLVTTPEKLDLLVRQGHPAVENLSLVVVDEAHHIGDQDRGARLELLLATLKRERGNSCRFLLMTPFLPNAPDLAKWLGGVDGAAISLDWAPSEQLRALGKWRKRNGVFHNVLELVPSVTQPTEWDGKEVDLGISTIQPATKGRPSISASLASSLAARSGGGSLVLTRGVGTAERRALEISRTIEGQATPVDDALLDATIKYVRSELGEEYPLVQTLPHGVAFHHAGLPPEVRSLVESLLERGVVRIVAGTSTLAQGVNFPLASVVVETLHVSQGRGKPSRDLRFSEFWNIAGRAGRAMKDPVGLVIYPSVGSADDRKYRDYLRGEAVNVVSALAQVFSALDEQQPFGLKMVRDSPSLGHFLQFLTHAVRVSGFDRAMAEVEEILRSSLVFSELWRSEDQTAAQQLVRWSRRFLASIRENSLVSVADVTGLSLPSVGNLAANARREMSEVGFWSPENLFGDDLEPLTGVVELLADLPEMRLAPTDEPGRIDARRVAGVMRDWVAGRTLPEIASEWFGGGPQALVSAGRYLFRELTGQLPWGIGALQLVGLGQGDETSEGVLARRVPAMAFYGVSEEHALQMRMVGVPRAAASGLGRHAPEFGSFASAREWLRQLPLTAWEEATEGREVSGAAARVVWEEVGGSAG